MGNYSTPPAGHCRFASVELATQAFYYAAVTWNAIIDQLTSEFAHFIVNSGRELYMHIIWSQLFNMFLKDQRQYQ